MSEFHVHGAVPLDSPAYVKRSFENAVLKDILARRWVLLLGPKQHGKSSGLARVAQGVRNAGVKCAFIDLQSKAHCASYRDLLHWLANEVRRELGVANASVPAQQHENELLSWLEAVLPPGAEPVVVIIDEASAIPNDSWRRSLYGQLRGIANLRAMAASGTVPSRLRMIFSGTFRPELLVDEHNSPFNVSERLETDDLSLDDARDLAKEVGGDAMIPYAEKAYAHVGGQPYLLQRIFDDVYAAPEAGRAAAYEAAIQRFRDGEDDHFADLFSAIFEDEALVQIVSRLIAEGAVDIPPADRNYKFLTVLGICQRDGGRLVFRNALYAEIAARSPSLTASVANAGTRAHMIVLPEQRFAFISDIQIREVVFNFHRGAAMCYRNGSYRLALGGLGCALEAVLTWWIESASGADRGTAISAAKADRKDPCHFKGPYEKEADVRSWRLVNLMRVGRFMPRSLGAPDLPETLREWWNIVHPAVILQNYRDEASIEPEARAASALFEMVLRDVKP